jgi:predicted nucleotidyltransferase component of viral defense system
MKEQLWAILEGADEPGRAANLVREYVQVRVLEGLQRCGAMVPLAFHGGTALRLLYRTPRFSEDLDFALERPGAGTFDLTSCLDRIRQAMVREGYTVTTRAKTERTVQIGWLRFPGLVQELGLQLQTARMLAVKIEIDTHPPEGAGLETTLIRRYVPLHLQHHDRSTLLAGKIAAVLLRPWTKGRDLFDLFWYLTDPEWPPPNLRLLNNALAQAGAADGPLETASWRPVLQEKIRLLDWAVVRQDLDPFIESAEALDLFDRENLLRLLG